MSYTKRLLCLANSRKLSGRCVAGREAFAHGWGAWVRPISARPHEEVSDERRYEDGSDPSLGDVIDVPLLEHRPRTYQQENHLLDDKRYWVKVQSASWEEIVGALDEAPDRLWENGHSSYNGISDRVPVERADAFDRSLFLLRPQNLKLLVQAEWGGRRKVRGTFRCAVSTIASWSLIPSSRSATSRRRLASTTWLTVFSASAWASPSQGMRTSLLRR